MYNIKVDTHTHTIFSKHAYSTVEENARAAKEVGLEGLAITDHYSSLFVPTTDFVNYGNFWNMNNMPKNWYGVEMYYGAEADIVNMEGKLFGYDLTVPSIWCKDHLTYLEWLHNKVDFLIASIHNGIFADGKTKLEITDMYCKAMNQKKVLIMGHLGRDRYPFEIKEVVKCAKASHVLIELNEISFSNPEYVDRVGRELATACAEYGVPVSIGSDAHCSYKIGKYEGVVSILKEIAFPEELIATLTNERFMRLIEKRI